MSFSSEDAALINNRNHIVQYKLELLNENLIAESELTGDTAEVNFNIDSTTDIRRTADLTMVVEDETWMTDNFEIGWLNKLIRFSIGLKRPDGTYEEPEDKYKWYEIGTMLLSSDAFRFDTATKELHLSLVDMMAYGTSERGSQIGTGVMLEHNSEIGALLSRVIAWFMPYNETVITEDWPDVLPYDMKFGAGSYPYDILRAILALFPWYEQYYDTKGKYHADKIPMNIEEDCLLYPEDIDDLIIAENRSFDFSKVKNTTEIYGHSITSHYTASTCTLSGDTYTLSFPLSVMETLENNKKYGFTPTEDSPESPKIDIALTDPEAQHKADLLDSTGEELPAGALRAGYAYVARCLDVPEARYDDHGNQQVVMVKKFFLMGQKEIHVIVREMNEMPSAEVIEADKNRNDCADIKYVINPESPYACDRIRNQPKYNAVSCTHNAGTYTLTFDPALRAFEKNNRYSFRPNVDSLAAPKVYTALTDPTEQSTLDLVDKHGAPLAADALEADNVYVFQCLETMERIGFTPRIVKKLFLVGKANRYTISTGEIRQVLYDGEYANIYTTQLGYERGEYENYLKCRMNTDVELTTVLIPFIDVNQKIEYTSPITGDVHQYIVKAVNMDITNFTMTMKLARFYNYYPTGEEEEE